MAGDGGRVPDVSEQRAEVLLAKIRDQAKYLSEPAWTLEGCALVGKQVYQWAAEAEEALSDPASVLAALLAESPEATVAAIEALLTSDEAVEDAHAILYRQFAGPRTRDTVRHAFAAACRSLLSKAPKEDKR